MANLVNYPAEVVSAADEASGVKTIKMKVPEDFSFIAGQFLMMSFEKDGKTIRRPYSIASPPYLKGFLEITVKLVEGGDASTYIHSLKKGDTLEISAPFGKFNVGEICKECDVVFISTGTGYTPLRSMMLQLLHDSFTNKVTVIKGCRYVNEIIFTKELDGLKKKHKNLFVYNIISRPEKEGYEKGYVQDLIKKHINKDFKGNIYICGLRDMINSARDLLIEIGIPKEQIHYEGYN